MTTVDELVSMESASARESSPKGRMHRSAYSDTSLFDLEMERIFEGGWVYVGHETELPLVGDYKTVMIGRQPVIVSRHRDKTVHLFMNRCMHRGAMICMEECGNTSGFRCIYHGWTYDNAGALLGVPYMKGGYGPDFDKSSLGLAEVARVAVHRGFIFASLRSEGPSLHEHLGHAVRYLDLLSDQSVSGQLYVRRKCGRYTVRANWKFQAENVVDGYHPRFTHETAFDVIKARTGKDPGLASADQSQARSIGFQSGHAVLDYSAAGRGYSVTDSPELVSYRQQVEERLGAERAADVLGADLQLYLFPNFFIQTGRQHIRIFRPISVDETEVLIYPYSIEGTGDAATAKQLSAVAWWASPAGFGQPEDIEALARCQAGLAVGDSEWLLYNRGLGREQVGPVGEIIGNVTDEVPQRAIHAGWRAAMGISADGGK